MPEPRLVTGIDTGTDNKGKVALRINFAHIDGQPDNLTLTLDPDAAAGLGGSMIANAGLAHVQKAQVGALEAMLARK